VAEDSHVPPLPRRAPDEKRHVPGGKPGWGSGLTQPLVLPESVRQRIRAALDYADDEAPPPGNGALPAQQAAPPPEAAAPQEAVAPAERPPAEQQPDRHDRRDGAGSGDRPPASPPTPVTRVAMWAYLGQMDAPTEPLPAVPAASQDEVSSRQKSGQASLGKAQLHGANGLAGRPGESPPWAPVPPPTAAPPKFAPPKSVSPQPVSPQPVSPKPVPPKPAPPQTATPKPAPPQTVPPKPAPPQTVPPQPPPPKAPAPRAEPARPGDRARRGRGFKVGVALALVLALAGSLAFLLKRQKGTEQAIPPATGPTASATPGTAAEVRAAAAAWVASQVSRAKPISCDQVMCRALRAHGVPAADLLVLRPSGGDPLHSGVIVVTATVTKMVGTQFLTTDAPAAIASFGSGSRQISIRVVYPQGAAAYAAALRQDIAERKTAEITLLENPRITAPSAARRQLQEGQIDPRLLLTLAQLASQWPLSIMAFGDRAPGASPGVPLRSADLAVTGDAARQARQMSAFAHGLEGYFADARIRAVRLANGQDGVQVEFAAPSPLVVLNG
jgi:hypothetical protein